jgi:hypothetical protein
MRSPTPIAAQLEWWRHAVETGDLTRHGNDLPPCGWFKARLKRGSKTWLPARIWLHQPMDWTTGELTEPERFVLEIEDRTVMDQDQVWEMSLFLRPVTLDEWKWLRARRALHLSPLSGMLAQTSIFG